ncbi:putative membrane protein [Agromyces sp. 3263]|uniref:SHOCT domain-containing protein n=1 Tax=Agromyces sp. 3263 TaxID=2817750 RepID=UPI002857A396|nr:SHOCT domain-containing protein [Agromyces sp. 3263]MDR6906078.1 putative membrane protein [Agromyces sp. 3263]
MGYGFTGWHILVILAVLLVIAAVVAAVIVVAIVASRRVAAPSQPNVQAPSARLSQLEHLRVNGQITEQEYAAKRAEILGQL